MRWVRRRSGPPTARESSEDVRFFCFFGDKEAARSAVLTLEAQGFSVTLTVPLTELAQWMVIAWGVPDTADLGVADDRFAEWVSDVGGEFGGHATKRG